MTRQSRRILRDVPAATTAASPPLLGAPSWQGARPQLAACQAPLGTSCGRHRSQGSSAVLDETGGGWVSLCWALLLHVQTLHFLCPASSDPPASLEGLPSTTAYSGARGFGTEPSSEFADRGKDTPPPQVETQPSPPRGCLQHSCLPSSPRTLCASPHCPCCRLVQAWRRC